MFNFFSKFFAFFVKFIFFLINGIFNQNCRPTKSEIKSNKSLVPGDINIDFGLIINY